MLPRVEKFSQKESKLIWFQLKNNFSRRSSSPALTKLRWNRVETQVKSVQRTQKTREEKIYFGNFLIDQTKDGAFQQTKIIFPPNFPFSRRWKSVRLKVSFPRFAISTIQPKRKKIEIQLVENKSSVLHTLVAWLKARFSGSMKQYFCKTLIKFYDDFPLFHYWYPF